MERRGQGGRKRQNEKTQRQKEGRDRWKRCRNRQRKVDTVIVGGQKEGEGEEIFILSE